VNRSPLRGPLLIVLVIAVAGTVVFGLRGRGGPESVGEVPATLPSGGVVVGGSVVLKPLSPPPAHALTPAAAIAKARRYATKRPLPASTLEAALTVNGNSHLQSKPAWIVTFTSPKATDVSQSGTPVLVKHFSVAVDATTGSFLIGFFTK